MIPCGFEPVSAKTQPVSQPSVPKFRILKIHRAETRLRNLGVSHEISDIPRQRPGSWRQPPEMSPVLRMPGNLGEAAPEKAGRRCRSVPQRDMMMKSTKSIAPREARAVLPQESQREQRAQGAVSNRPQTPSFDRSIENLTRVLGGHHDSSCQESGPVGCDGDWRQSPCAPCCANGLFAGSSPAIGEAGSNRPHVGSDSPTISCTPYGAERRAPGPMVSRPRTSGRHFEGRLFQRTKIGVSDFRRQFLARRCSARASGVQHGIDRAFQANRVEHSVDRVF
jgi:hypothetical protein